MYSRGSKKHFWQDEYGDFNIPSILAIAFTILVLIFGGITGLVAYGSTQGCHAKLDAYGKQGHYNFWANTCFAELPGGSVNIDNLRQNSKGYTFYTPDLEQPSK